MTTTAILLCILIGCMVAAISGMIARSGKSKTWIDVRNLTNGQMRRIGFLVYNAEGEASEVKQAGSGRRPPLGSVAFTDPMINGAVVELLVSADDDDSPRYRECGYITPEGTIYKRIKGRRQERIGYTARPSAPLVPQTKGERSWKTLWLVSCLNAYAGVPAQSGRPQPVASVRRKGFASADKGDVSPEARACGFGMLFRQYGRRRGYMEQRADRPYGWKDTAWPTAVVYTVGYILLYMICRHLLGLHFIGYHFDDAVLDAALYYPLWAIVRQIKIDRIENSEYAQARIDLFDKRLGQHGMDIVMLVSALLTVVFTLRFYRFDFLPVAWVIAFGTAVNMTLKGTNEPWRVLTSDDRDESESDDMTDDEPRNPTGNIEKTYSWTLDPAFRETVPLRGNLSLYFTADYIESLRRVNPFYPQRCAKGYSAYIKDMFRTLREHPALTARLRYLCRYMERCADKAMLDSQLARLQFALDFVQEPNIAFVVNEESAAIDRFADYIRWPDETLFDKCGDCNSKALLAAMIFSIMGYDLIYLYSRGRQHAAVGVELQDEWKDLEIGGAAVRDLAFEFGGREYLLCEVTVDGVTLGSMPDGLSESEFDDIVELRLDDADLDDVNPTDSSMTRTYAWTLDSQRGNRLDGQLVLEFDEMAIASLRHSNPFLTYGSDSSTYEDNIRKIIQYVSADPERSEKVRQVARYIESAITEAGLPEIEKVQFALDFVQAPNIAYCIDENSAGIGYAKEYMRYPDEVLFDKEGDCDCKSSLMAALFHELGYRTVIMISVKLAHAAIGVELPASVLEQIDFKDRERALREYNGHTYVYCETTGDGFRVGVVDEGQSIHEFETLVEL